MAVCLFNVYYTPLPGVTSVVVCISRGSDLLMYDFSTSTFRATSAVVAPTAAMVPLPNDPAGRLHFGIAAPDPAQFVDGPYPVACIPSTGPPSGGVVEMRGGSDASAGTQAVGTPSSASTPTSLVVQGLAPGVNFVGWLATCGGQTLKVVTSTPGAGGLYTLGFGSASFGGTPVPPMTVVLTPPSAYQS